MDNAVPELEQGPGEVGGEPPLVGVASLLVSRSVIRAALGVEPRPATAEPATLGVEPRPATAEPATHPTSTIPTREGASR